MENNERKLDDLLSKAQDPNRIKTAKEFMSAKKQEEMSAMQGSLDMSMGYVSESIAMEEECTEMCAEEQCSPEEPCDSSQNSEQTTSSI